MPTDPRPRRQADLLASHGVDVTVVGYSGAGGAEHPWRYVAVPAPTFTVAGKAAEVGRLATARVSPRLARRTHQMAARHRAIAVALSDVEADVYVTHDYAALPMVAAAARRHSARYAYDCREFYAGQHADSAVWQLVAPPAVRAVEGYFVHDAAWVTTVSDGLADLLARSYSLSSRPTVVRSTPLLVELPEHVPGDRWTALFHGHLRPDRNVHGLVESVPLWPDHIRLELRGGGSPGYLRSLRQQVDDLGVGDRVELSPPVTWSEVIPSAAAADLGVIPWGLDLPQKRISLPNKLFEYLMAGLAVVATAPSEASRLIEGYGAGVGYAPATPAALATTLRELDGTDLRAMRAAAARARLELCWENESAVLWRLWEQTLSG